jgi:hypothetical protein
MIYKVKNDRELAVYWNGHLIYHKKLKTGGDWRQRCRTSLPSTRSMKVSFCHEVASICPLRPKQVKG